MRRFALALVLACAALPGIAHADGPGPSEPSAADKETARALFREGDDHFIAGDHQAALEAFRAADDIMHVPTTGLEVGRTEAALGQLVEARATLLRVSIMPAAAGENDHFAQARAEAAALAQAIGTRIPSLTVVVTGLPPGTEPTVSIDGVALAGASRRHPRKLDPGEHLVSAVAPGHREATRTLTVAEREQAFVELELVALEPDELPPPVATVAPATPGALERVPVWGWVGFGVGAAGLIVGTAAGAATLGNVSELDGRCPERHCAPGDEADLDGAEALSHLSTAGFVIGAAGIGAGVASLFVGDEPFFGAGEAPNGQQSGSVLLGPTSACVRGRF